MRDKILPSTRNNKKKERPELSISRSSAISNVRTTMFAVGPYEGAKTSPFAATLPLGDKPLWKFRRLNSSRFFFPLRNSGRSIEITIWFAEDRKSDNSVASSDNATFKPRRGACKTNFYRIGTQKKWLDLSDRGPEPARLPRDGAGPWSPEADRTACRFE